MRGRGRKHQSVRVRLGSGWPSGQSQSVLEEMGEREVLAKEQEIWLKMKWAQRNKKHNCGG